MTLDTWRSKVKVAGLENVWA